MRTGEDITTNEAFSAWIWAASAGCFGSVIAIILAALLAVVWFHWTFDGRGM